MKIIFKKKFIKHYKKLHTGDRKNVDSAIKLFEKNPNDKKLNNHQLVGKLQGKRSISAGYDLRIVFEEFENYSVVFMLRVGTHNQVY